MFSQVPGTLAVSTLSLLLLQFASSNLGDSGAFSSVVSTNECLRQNFLGFYGDGDRGTLGLFLLTTPQCLSAGDALNNAVWFYNLTLLASEARGATRKERLVWVEQEELDLRTMMRNGSGINGGASWTEPGTVESLVKSLLAVPPMPAHSALFDVPHQQQTRLPGLDLGLDDEPTQTTMGTPRVLYTSSSGTSGLLVLPEDEALLVDTRMPRFWKSTVVPDTPSEYRTVSDDDVKRVRETLATLKYNGTVATILDALSLPQIQADVRFLTGEDASSGITTRNSLSRGARVAAQWLKEQVEGSGSGVRCHLESFLPAFAPNVICRYQSIQETNDTLILSAHYDSRGSFTSPHRAPGADDDASGTSGVLAIARAIAHSGVRFREVNVELVFFAGEEQRLFGSHAYAKKLRKENTTRIVMMVQADMTAYRVPGEPMQLGLPVRIGTPEVTYLLGNVSGLYSPELSVGYSSACCSDHQSFFQQGYPASQVFERAGPIADPMYHNSGE